MNLIILIKPINDKICITINEFELILKNPIKMTKITLLPNIKSYNYISKIEKIYFKFTNI